MYAYPFKIRAEEGGSAVKVLNCEYIVRKRKAGATATTENFENECKKCNYGYLVAGDASDANACK